MANLRGSGGHGVPQIYPSFSVLVGMLVCPLFWFVVYSLYIILCLSLTFFVTGWCPSLSFRLKLVWIFRWSLILSLHSLPGFISLSLLLVWYWHGIRIGAPHRKEIQWDKINGLEGGIIQDKYKESNSIAMRILVTASILFSMLYEPYTGLFRYPQWVTKCTARCFALRKPLSYTKLMAIIAIQWFVNK